ncbi:MAG TPA: hypothetical protein VGQ57_02240, partial [Polyangiaceae bacterium]|nr:hypothetical protein [Polyangiaceae bacterium]
MQSKILHRIAVAAPYFALDSVEFDGAELRAEAGAETEAGEEVGPMSGAEIARHAVVAGLSAVALGRPDAARCYYLASSIDATYYRSAAAFGTRVRFSARATEQGPVGGAAQVDVRIGHELLGHAALSFAVVPESLFERLFARHRAATFDDHGSHRSYPPLDALWHDQKDAHARLP